METTIQSLGCGLFGLCSFACLKGTITSAPWIVVELFVVMLCKLDSWTCSSYMPKSLLRTWVCRGSESDTKPRCFLDS